MLCRPLCEHGYLNLGLHPYHDHGRCNNPQTYLAFPYPKTSFKLQTHHHQFLPTRSCSTRQAAGRSKVKDEMIQESQETEESFYELLGISESGSFSEIKQAYKQLARKYHPDVSPSDKTHEYTERFIQVQEAYETLSDPDRRALYDRDLAQGLHLAFSARTRSYHQGASMERTEWKSNWQAQVAELKRKSMKKDVGNNLNWAAQMRRNRDNGQN